MKRSRRARAATITSRSSIGSSARTAGSCWVHDNAALVQLPGQPTYWQGLLLDVTEGKLAEEQLARALEAERDAAQRLRALDEMKNTFLQAVSHDLRTPLAAILGLAVTLEREDIAMEAGEARDLAATYRQERAQARPSRDGPAGHGPARAGDRVAEARIPRRGRCRPTDGGRLGGDRPIASDDRHRRVLIPVDASKVERIIENLLANTARHTPSNAHVWVSVHPHESGALIKIEDSGVGVPADLREADLRAVPAGTRGAAAFTGRRRRTHARAAVRRAPRRRAWIEERDGGGSSFQVFLPGRQPVETSG